MIDIYYIDDVDYDKDPYATLLLYFYEDKNIEYKLTYSDKNAIEGYGK